MINIYKQKTINLSLNNKVVLNTIKSSNRPFSIINYNNNRLFCTSSNNNKDINNNESLIKDEKLNNVDPSIILLKYEPNVKHMTKEEMKKDERPWHLRLMGFYSKDTLSLHNSYNIYEAITKQSSDIEFYKQFGLPVNVRSWFAVSVLNIWISYVRLRKEGAKNSKQIQIDLYDRFWEDLEKKIALAGIKRRFIPKYLREFYTSYLGSLIAYDEALFDDATLVNAIWRNFFAMSEDVKTEQLLNLVKYVRYQLNHLDNDVKEVINIDYIPINKVKSL
ncbi:hypothetical protein DICPUDRAFT_146713 [Dictyostelium purpureum]|uniref:Ubiquinol-cytochrome c chaperone domain-containing protein n=1 Tax=Dictyostelium purpureum TaxID=5786 RepID=F0Z6U3_DICPU|nr:uncharacterized protein DICPUDRAFT_146713 [Dictyostelium purpureum]EGC40322.1 hypothetical protein DICPUDRAFT_146713 [Dictyostelium purpureum]|eukprot:XP_003283073.1 hypothetical protein DICPUDRAFT_146713 [Dictyostelium purpureum]